MPKQVASVSQDPQSPEFDTADLAAKSLEPQLSVSANKGVEFAGVLFQNARGKYQYSTLIPGDHDNFKLSAQVPKGSKIAAIVHSHPGEDDVGQVFSPNDIQIANQLKVPSYVHFLKSGSTRKYVPGKTATRFLNSSSRLDRPRVADGDPLDDSAAPLQPQDTSKEVLVAGAELTAMAPTTPQIPIGNLQNNAPSLDSLKSTMPSSVPQSAGVSASPTPAAQASNAGLLSQAQAQNASSQNYNAGQIGSQDSTNASAQLDAITAEDSPYMQLARQQGMLTAASRGLQNSSLAAGASEASAVQAAAPLAEQNASEAATAVQQNAALGTQVSEQNAQLGTQANEFNASENISQDQLNAQLGTQTSQFNAGQAQQASEFNAQQTQQNNQLNAQISAQTQQEILQQNADLNKQYLSGTQAEDLATIQGQYNQLIATNQAAATLYQSYLSSIGQAMANKDIDPARIAQDIQAQQAMLSSGLQLIDSINGGGVTGGSPTPDTGVGPGMPNIISNGNQLEVLGTATPSMLNTTPVPWTPPRPKLPPA